MCAFQTRNKQERQWVGLSVTQHQIMSYLYRYNFYGAWQQKDGIITKITPSFFIDF